MKPQRIGKARRIAFFIFCLLMLGGLHFMGMLVHRPIPWWVTLGWLAFTGWMCWTGWDDDEDEIHEAYKRRQSQRPAGLQRLADLAVLLGGLGMCWLGWMGWKTRHDHMLGVLMVFLGPVGALWLLWLLGRWVSSLRDKR